MTNQKIKYIGGTPESISKLANLFKGRTGTTPEATTGMKDGGPVDKKNRVKLSIGGLTGGKGGFPRSDPEIIYNSSLFDVAFSFNLGVEIEALIPGNAAKLIITNRLIILKTTIFFTIFYFLPYTVLSS